MSKLSQQPKKGYDATIETDYGTFHAKNFTNVDPEEVGVDVYDDEDKFIGQVTGVQIDFPTDLEDEDNIETYLNNSAQIREYIEAELV